MYSLSSVRHQPHICGEIEVGIANGKPRPPACNDVVKCANPACNVPFRYFRTGKIFMLEANDGDPRSRADPPKRRIEYFWLCGECTPGMHLMRTTDGVTLCQSHGPSDPRRYSGL
jgi:hypothetical protein